MFVSSTFLAEALHQLVGYGQAQGHDLEVGPGHDGQQLLPPILLHGDGVDHRDALVDGQGRLYGLGIGAVEGAGLLGDRLDRGGQPLEVVGLLADEDAGVDVDVVGPGLVLLGRHRLDVGVVALLDGLPDGLAAGVDQLADDYH